MENHAWLYNPNAAKVFVKAIQKEFKVLIQYLYDDNFSRCGVIVALNKDRVGYSWVSNKDYVVQISRVDFHVISFDPEEHRKSKDILHSSYPLFDRWIGLALAITRALNNYEPPVKLPEYVQTGIDAMKKRASKYYK